MHTTFPTHLIFLDLITPIILGEVYKLWSSLLHSLLQLPTTSSLLGPYTVLITLSLCSLNVRDQVLQLHKTVGTIILLCVLKFKFLEEIRRWKILN